ncbi:MAG: VCBS repeat-containing protein [Armatimonadetes bacterium]|nr:VCBS repeat-containing protein [Armatimonadota bacterium]
MRAIALFSLLLVGAISAYGAANEETTRMQDVKITQLKRLCVDTPLVARGRPTCVIAAPDEPGYLPLAQRLAAAIQRACGVAPPIRAASDVARQMPPTENVIALGFFLNNKVVEDLYFRETVQCDYNWRDGARSYEIRTVHDPWLNGKNVVYLGSTTLEGCRAAVDRFIQVLAEHPNGSIAPLIEVVTDGERPAPPSDAEAARIRGQIQGGTLGTRNTLYIAASNCAGSYFATGHSTWARLFLEALRRIDEVEGNEEGVRGTVAFQYVFHLYDCIEDGAAFTDAERLEATNLLYRFAARLEEAKPAPIWEPMTRSVGNWTLTGAFAALYFSRSYPELELSQRLLTNMDRFYSPDMVNWKPPEDSPAYAYTTAGRSFKWALHRPDRHYMESGLLRKLADYYMLVTNNLGKAAGFGDYDSVRHTPQPMAIHVAADWFYRDGRYLWWYEHVAKQTTTPSGHPFWNGRNQGPLAWLPPEVLPRKRPDDLLGIVRAPLDDWIYRRRDVANYLGRSYEETHQFPIEECYDKVSFRAGFEPEDQYLLMSGFGWGYHSHPHANAIINYTDQRQTMLFDDGYNVAQPSEHNTVIVLKDGMTAGSPELAQVRAQADFPSTGMLVSRLNDYSSMDWDRSVIWSKSRYFLVIDDLKAREPARYTLQCIWRALGKADLGGRRWVSENPPGRFNLIACSDAALKQKPATGERDDPPFATDKARRLVQSVSREMNPGDRYQFANLFYSTLDTGTVQRVDAYRVGNTTTCLVEDDGKLALAGVRGSDAIPGLAIEGAAYHLQGDTLTVAGATRVAVGGPLFSSDVPVSLQANLRTGEATVQVGKAAQVTFAAAQGEKTQRLEYGSHTVQLRPVPAGSLQGIAREVQTALVRARALVAPTEKPRVGAGEGLRERWSYQVGGVERQAGGARSWHPNVVRAADINGDGMNELLVAGADNAVHAINADGRRLWRHPLPDLIHDLSVTGDRRQILVGCNDSTVYSLKPDGSINWSVVPEPKDVPGLGERIQGQPVVVFASDINGDGRTEVIVGVNRMCLYAYDDSGKLLWDAQPRAGAITCGTAFDLDGDGRQELVIGNSYDSACIHSADGAVIGRAGGTGHAGPIAVACADVDGDGQAEIMVGDKLGKVWLQKAVREGGWSSRKETKVYDTGGDITSVAIGDVNGDGKLETAIASKSFLLHLFDAERNPVWHLDLEDVCLDIDVGDVNRDGCAEIVCGCEDGTVKVVDGSGKVIAWYQTAAPVNSVRVCELDGRPETKEIVASCEDGTVCALQVVR